MWLIIIGVLIVIGVFAIASEQSSANDVEKAKYVTQEVKEHVNKRIAAYADYLRRTSTDEIRAMTDNELHVLIERAMEGYENEQAKVKKWANISFVLGALAGVALFAGDESAGPVAGMLIVVGFCIRDWGKKRVDNKYVNNGWEPSRLKVL